MSQRICIFLFGLVAGVTAAALVAGLLTLAGGPLGGQLPGWVLPVAGAAAVGLLAGGVAWLARLAAAHRELVRAAAEERFELEGLNGLVDGLRRDRDRFREEVERLKPEQLLSSAATAHDNLDNYISTLAGVVAKALSGARELTIFRSVTDDPDAPVPRAHYRLEPEGSELFLAFTPEGGQLLGDALEDNLLPARKFGVRSVSISAQQTEFHVKADLGFTLPDRTKKPVGDVLLVLPRRDPDRELPKPVATDQLKAEVAQVVIDAANVGKALTHPMPQRFDGGRQILELAIRLGTESEHLGVLVAGFDTTGVDVGEKAPLWESLLTHASGHLARALRGQSFQERAIKDGLTGLYNKSFMWEKLGDAFIRARDEGQDLSLVMVDIDKFKAVNDTYGHQTGDIILKGVAETLANSARASDFAFRFGGEEMGFILSGQNARKALAMANRARKAVAKQEFVGEKGEVVSVSISLGVCHYTDDMEAAEDLMSRADEALYYAKENGRNQAVAWGAKKMSVRKG